MEPLYKGHIGTLETVLYIEVVLNSGNSTVEPLYRGHIRTLETVEVVLRGNILKKQDKCPLFGDKFIIIFTISSVYNQYNREYTSHTHLKVWSKQIPRDGSVAASMTKYPTTYSAVMSANKHSKLYTTVRTLLARLIWHPVFLEVIIVVL